MPKVKRFRNPQKSAPQPQCPSPSDSTQAPEVPTGNVPLSIINRTPGIVTKKIKFYY